METGIRDHALEPDPQGAPAGTEMIPPRLVGRPWPTNARETRNAIATDELINVVVDFIIAQDLLD